MNIAVKLSLNPGDHSVAAYCSLILDGSWAVHEVKLVRRREPGALGDHFTVAMPAKKLTTPCVNCRGKNPLQANYCNACGHELTHALAADAKLYADMAHPLDPDTRLRVHRAVMDAYRQALLIRRGTHEPVANAGTPTPAELPQHEAPGAARNAAEGAVHDR